jgi:pSer/pThr/pTyr-binding forkhead associated (FHA) protein
MAKLTLQFEDKVLKEVKVGVRPITIGRTPDNDLQIDNLGVSTHHARIYPEEGKLVIEDLDSLNGTFLNNHRVEKSPLEENDRILIGKHTILVREAHDIPESATVFVPPKRELPKVQETLVIDSKKRRELLEQALGAAQAAQAAKPAPARVQVANLVVVKGKTDQKEYPLLNKLTVIGKSEMATIKMMGFFARLFGPEVSAQINKRDAGYFLNRAGAVPKLNGTPVLGPTKLNNGDVIEVGGVRFTFVLRD